MDDLKDTVDKLPCSENKELININRQNTDKDILKANDTIWALANRLASVESKVDRWDNRMIDLALSSASSAKKRSPYSLTDIGKVLLERSGGDKCIDDNKLHFFNEIDKLPHSTPFDVERAAIGIVLDSFNSDITNPVKDFIYNSSDVIEINGEERRFTVNDIQVAMAICLRDSYLNERGMVSN